MKHEDGPFNLSAILLMVAAALCFFISASPTPAQERRAKIRISNATLSFTALPLLAAQEWKLFTENGLDVEVIIMTSSIAAPAMMAGDIDYVSGVGPASVSATLSGLPSRAIWFSSDRIAYWLMAKPQFKSIQDLKSRKIGLSGLGGTTQVALMMALEKFGANPKDFVIVSIPAAQLLQSLESGFVDAAALHPPPMFFAQRKGFNKLLDIAASVEMPGGGLTALIKTIKSRPDEVKKVIKSLQMAKGTIRKSKEKTVGLMVRILKMDREAASETYDLFLTILSETGIPSRAGMENIVKAIKSLGRFTDRNVAFEDVADAKLATEVAKELGYKIR